MLTRIVELNFKKEHVEEFLTDFHIKKARIRNFDGCIQLKLLRDRENTTKFFTYSVWESELHLENYRKSAVFKNIWSMTKPLFSKKATAWSVDVIDEVNR